MDLQAVVTTGIYCRASCTARPLQKNVRPMRNALEAQASGFRPCLLCRPDRLPGIGVEQPAAEIAQALRLIAEGFLDTATTEELAARIGYSSRQLVRLFEEHIGATPDFVARSRRAHLARRLLDESDLTITKIAYVAGFTSIRQMNRVVRALFGFSPSELRQKRRRGDVMDALDGGLRLRLPYSGRLDVEHMVLYLGTRAIPGIETSDGDMYRRTMTTCGAAGVVDVRDFGDDKHLEVTMHLGTFASIIDQVEQVRSLFGLRQDHEAAESALRRDKLLGPLVRRTPGLRMAGAWNRFETAVRIIVGQQVSVVGASTACGRIAAQFGEQVRAELPGGLSSLFPTPDVLAQADLEGIGMPNARGRTVVAFARAVASGELDLSAADTLEDTCASLEALPGIGPWTSNLIAARVMGHMDAFAANDLGLRKGAAHLLGQSELPTALELAAMAERWRPYRTTAMTYLWRAAVEQHKAKKRGTR